MKYIGILTILFISVISGQDEGVMQRLIYEFPISRPAYSPLKNEIEVAPRINYWGDISAGIDLEYALSKNLIVEAGISYSKEEAALPLYVQEPGIEAGLYYTFASSSSFTLTAGLESGYPFSKPGFSESEISFEPILIGATTIGSFQFHCAAGGEFEEGKFNPTFYIASILNRPGIRPFIQVTARQSLNGTVIAPGLSLPFSDDLQLGIGVPVITGKKPAAGIILFLAIEIGDDN